MGRRFFNPEDGLWRLLGYLGDLLLLSILWTLCAAPLITLGAATAALYNAVVQGFFRHKPDYLLAFFRSFRRELKNALAPTLLWAMALGALFWLFRLCAGRLDGSAGLVFAAALSVLFLLPFGIACWVFPLLSRFTLGFGALNANAARLALGHLPRTLLLAALCAGAIWLTLRLALLPLFFLPALAALLAAALLEPVLQRYEEQAQAQDTE